MTAMLLGWLSSHWLILAAIAVAIAAIFNPVAVWKAKAWILLAGVLWWGWTGHAAYDSLKAKTDADTAKAAQQIAEANAKASEAAREEEQTRARYVAGIDKAYQEGLKDAQRKGDAVAADLRAGNLRLREQWRGCEARGVPDAAAGSGGADAAADLRAASTGRIVGAGAKADQQIRCLQAIALTDRGIDPGDLRKSCPDPPAQ
jgi:hypothetical protein